MAQRNDEPQIYQALALPEQAIENGGLEVLRLGIIDDELYVSALPAFQDVGQWGEVLAEVARRLGLIYAARVDGLSGHDATIQIAEAFVADMGGRPVPSANPPKLVKRKARKAKTPVRSVSRKKR